MRKWTIDTLRAEAARYSTAADFRREQQSAYVTASRLGVLDDICGHMTRSKRKLTRSEVQRLASQFETLAEFASADPSAYSTAHRRGWMDVLSGLKRHEKTRKPQRPRKKIHPPGYWTKDRCAELAATCSTRVEFQRNHNVAYVIAFRRRWLDDICTHMAPAGSRVRRFVYRIWSEATREIYVGLTANPKRRYDMHRSRPRADMRALMEGLHRFEVLTETAVEFDEAATMERRLIRDYAAAGWRVLNILPGGEAGGRFDPKWTMEALRTLAATCRTRAEMRAKSNGAYVSASRRGLIDDLFRDHENGGLSKRRQRSGHWTLETLTEEAKRYTTRRAMRQGSQGAFVAAERLNLVDAIFANHPKQGRMAAARPKARRD